MDLYRGVVSHRRWPAPGAPAAHGFAYELFLALVDLDAPDAALRLWPLAARNAPALASFYDADHLPGARAPGERLGAAVRRLVAARVPGWAPPRGGRALLLTHLRTFGYVFNPISIFYLLDARGGVDALVAEVSNTPWGERHAYVLHARAPGVTASRAPRAPLGGGGGGGAEAAAAAAAAARAPPRPLSERARARLRGVGAVAPLDFDALAARFEGGGAGGRAGSRGRGRSASPARRAAGGGGAAAAAAAAAPAAASPTDVVRFRWAKDFHVSPFFGMDHEYDWRFSPPGDGTLLVQSRNVRAGATVFSTQLLLERAPATRARLAFFLLVAFPLLTFRIQWWIHVEAARLFLKGAALFPHPTGAQNACTRAVEAMLTPVVWAVAAARVCGGCCNRRRGGGSAHGA